MLKPALCIYSVTNLPKVSQTEDVLPPCLDNVAQIVETITTAKTEYDQKLEKQKQIEKERKLKDIEQTKGKTTEEAITKDPEDPASHVSEFLNNLPASAEEQPVKKSVLPELKNDFELTFDFSSSNSSKV
jgi:hypothetical protein